MSDTIAKSHTGKPGSELRRLASEAARGLLLIALFLVPAVAALEWVGWRTGETIPPSMAAKLQDARGPVLYQPKNGRDFAFKLARIKQLQPEVLVLGSSRTNLLRAEMFAPYSFYNGSQLAWSFAGYHEFLSHLDDYRPRVLIVPVDFFLFAETWWTGALDKKLNKDVNELPSPGEHLADIRRSLGFLFSAPVSDAPGRFSALVEGPRDPLFSIPAIGLGAIQGGGYLPDGSFVYAADERVLAPDRVMTEDWTWMGDKALRDAQVEDFKKFMKRATSMGITVVGVQMPIYREVIDYFEAPGEKRQIWKAFQDEETAAFLRSFGLIFINLADSEISDKKSNFIDPVHVTPRSMQIAVIEMLRDAQLKRLVPDVEIAPLEKALASSGPIFVYTP